MPWDRPSEDGKVYKYQYHPHGDKNQPLRDAPSALNTVIVPNVTLPAVRDLPLILNPKVGILQGVFRTDRIYV